MLVGGCPWLVAWNISPSPFSVSFLGFQKEQSSQLFSTPAPCLAPSLVLGRGPVSVADGWLFQPTFSCVDACKFELLRAVGSQVHESVQCSFL